MEKGRGRMAAQCRSPRCTSERRGFRRELDSWRHRLIHCVGFESILEGLYGPGLRRDLSLFDDCEPDELTDWCVDDRCSFCSLRKEAVGDCAPSICSSHSTPTEELVSQGPFNTEKIECQAENYLNALFRKKDLPQYCDPNIPLVAQELMKKMIRQFAIEYVSKSGKLQENRNGSSFESNLTCNGVKMNQTLNSLQEEQDGPLDLTVTRTLEQNARHGEDVLDLSTKKANICSGKSTILDPSYDTSVSRPCSCVDASMLSQSDETSKLKKATALNNVLDSLCKYHHQQILKMLKFLVHEKKVPSLTRSCNKLHLNPECKNVVHQVEGPLCSSIQHRHTRRCRFKNIKVNTALKPLSICIKDLRLSCKTVPLGSHKTVLNRGSCHNSHLQKCCGGSLNICGKCQCARRASYTPSHSSIVCDVSKNINEYSRTQSPSPPPLSPIETDQFKNVEKALGDLSVFETNILESNINQPPYLLPAEDYNIGRVCINGPSKQPDVFLPPNEQEHSQSSCNTETFDTSDNTVIFQDLLDRFNEKLNSIETCHMDTSTNVLKLSNVQKQENGSRKFGEYIKSLVHNARANDYSFMELLSQHEKIVESKTIQTRFRKRQKALFAMHSSANSSVYRRQSLQIKRELANFDETFVRQMSMSKKKSLKSKKADKTTIGRRSREGCREFESTDLEHPENNQNVPYQTKSMCLPVCQTQLSELPQQCFETNFSSVPCLKNSSGITLQNSICTTTQEETTNTHNHLEVASLEDVNACKGACSNPMERTKHNIECPTWRSVYVTNSVYAKKKKSLQTLENITIGKDREGERYKDMDLNKIAKSSNLQVIVERLEDTIHLSSRKFSTHSLEEQFKMSRKLTEDTFECNKTTCMRELKCTAFEFEGKKNNSIQKSPSSHSADKIECVSSDYVTKTDHNFMEFPLSCDSRCERQKMGYKICKDLSSCSYTSPIKLMFVSKVKSSEGFKYTLSSVDVSSKGNVVLCHFERSLESKATKTLEKVFNTRKRTKELCKNGNTTNSNDTVAVEEESRQSDHKLTTIICTADETEIKNCNKNEETVDKSNITEKAVLKRKPGRPKKIGPQIVKHIKRPIGRPPKPKVAVTGSAGNRREPRSTNNGTKSGATGNDNSNANIRVTVFFGRSRRTRRHVSEDVNNAVGTMALNYTSFPNESKGLLYNLETDKILHETHTLPSLAAERMMSGFGYEHVTPIKEQSVLPYSNSNVVHPNGMSLTVVRKLGRPPKVKISGISVTVNRVSSQERTVSLSNCLPSKDQETILENNVFKEKTKQCNKMDKTECVQRRSSRYGSHNASNLATANKVIQLRKSVRAKTPSFNFLHAVASSSTFTYRSALVHASYKLQLSKTKQCNGKMNHPVTNPGLDHTPEILQSCSPKDCGVSDGLCSAFEVSSDPIFLSDTSLKWWAASTSKETLLEDLNSRFEKMTKTWLKVDGNESKTDMSVKRDATEQEYNLKVSKPVKTCLLECELSPVKMLFQKQCDMNNLCSWFMQTTETKSLKMVRKENARSPLEMISNRKIKSGIQKPDLNLNASKKHFHKFSLPSPSKKSLKLQTSRKVERSHGLNKKNGIALVKLRTNRFCGLKHKNEKLQRNVHTQQTVACNSKSRNSRYLYQRKNNTAEKRNNAMSMFQGEKSLETQESFLHTESHFTGTSVPLRTQLPNLSEQANASNVRKRGKESKVNMNQQYVGKAVKQNEDCQNVCNLEDVKDCRVFLRKFKPSKLKVSCDQNTILPLAEPAQSPNSQSQHIVQKKYWTLRSHSAQRSVEKKPQRLENHNGKTLSNSTKTFSGSTVSTTSRSSRKPDNRFVNNSEDLVRNTKGKRCRSPVDTMELKVAKRQKRQPCRSTKITNYYSKFQLGPITPVGLPMLGGFKSRNVEYSMTPFRMPVRGTSQHTRNDYL